MTYDWIRLVLAAVAILPPLVFVGVLSPSTGLLRRLPSWLTWAQSLALTGLYAGVIGASLESIAYGRHTPSWPVEVVLFTSYAGLGAIRYWLLAWWVRDWRARRSTRIPKEAP